MPESEEGRSPLARFENSVHRLIDGPITWFRETIVEPNQQKYPWYHQTFRRVPTVDECYTTYDIPCHFEADQQFRRDRMVDNEIVAIMRQRFEDCVLYETPDHFEKCMPVLEEYKKAEANWFTKYGDLGAYATAQKAYMKQKHRLIWERRHGPVGSGMKTEDSF